MGEMSVDERAVRDGSYAAFCAEAMAEIQRERAAGRSPNALFVSPARDGEASVPNGLVLGGCEVVYDARQVHVRACERVTFVPPARHYGADTQAKCFHMLRADHAANALVCAACGLRIGGQALAAAGFMRREQEAYNSARNALADTCQTLADENRSLLAENATLRRRLERAKGGGR